MQLFRKQALDHQNRLHGEIFLVPPLRWQAIGALLLLLIIGCAAVLAMGTYSRTVTATGTLRDSDSINEPPQPYLASDEQPAWVATLRLPLVEADKIALGQPVSLVVDGYSLTEFGALQGSVANVGNVETNSTTPYREVTVAISEEALRRSGPKLHDGLKAEASIKIGEQALWRWLFKPILPHTSQ